MNVSIKTYYRIVKAVRDGDTYYVPQYQEEGDSESTFHNFRTELDGRTNECVEEYFDNLRDAKEFIEQYHLTADKVVFETAFFQDEPIA